MENIDWSKYALVDKERYVKDVKEIQDRNKKASDAIMKIIEGIDGDAIYPTSVFSELSAEQLVKINDLLIMNFKFPLDRLSAHISRRILNNLKKQFRENI